MASKKSEAYREFQRRAGVEMRKAIRQGLLERPDLCSRCGKRPFDKAIQGHHWTYDLPLDVEWLCCLCDIEAHHYGNYAIP